MIRIAIADDHELVRAGFQRVLERHPDMKVVGLAASGSEVAPLLREHEVDVLLLDISMPGPSFLTLMEQVQAQWPDVVVLVLSMHPEKTWAVRALRAGAAGYITKQRPAKELVEAIRRVHRGGRYVTRSLGEVLAAQLGPDAERPPHELLSRRELQVLCGLGAGKMAKDVAAELGLSPRTVATYRARILKKLHLTTTADLVRYAVEHQLEP